MATTRQIAGWAKTVEKRMAGVAKERDKLDETIAELEQLRGNCREAYDNLQIARDALSEMV
jgi:flagellin-like hook-associated protein FlgL